MSRLSEKERLRRFTLTIWRLVQPDSAGGLSEALEACDTIAPLRSSARDAIEMTQDISGADLSAIDLELERSSLPTLTQMRDRRFRDLQSVLSRNKIRTPEEARLVESFLVDVEQGALDSQDRDAAEYLLSAYSS